MPNKIDNKIIAESSEGVMQAYIAVEFKHRISAPIPTIAITGFVKYITRPHCFRDIAIFEPERRQENENKVANIAMGCIRKLFDKFEYKSLEIVNFDNLISTTQQEFFKSFVDYLDAVEIRNKPFMICDLDSGICMHDLHLTSIANIFPYGVDYYTMNINVKKTNLTNK